MTHSNPTSGHDPALNSGPRCRIRETLNDLAGVTTDLGGFIDGVWVLCDDTSTQARNAMLPILDAAKRLADDLAQEREIRVAALRGVTLNSGDA